MNLIGYLKMDNNILVIDWDEDQAGFVINDMRFMNSCEVIDYETNGCYGCVSYFRCLIPNEEFLSFLDSLDYNEYHSLMYKSVFHSYYNDSDDMIFSDGFHPVMIGLECIHQ